MNIPEYFNACACIARAAFFADRRLWDEVEPAQPAIGKPPVVAANPNNLELDFWKSLPSMSQPGEQMSLQEFQEDYDRDLYKLCDGIIKLHLGSVAEISGGWTRELPVQLHPVPTSSLAYHLQFAQTPEQRAVYRERGYPGSGTVCVTNQDSEMLLLLDETTWSNTFQRITERPTGNVIQARSASVITLPELLLLTAKHGISLHIAYSWWLSAHKIIKHKVHNGHFRSREAKAAQSQKRRKLKRAHAA